MESRLEKYNTKESSRRTSVLINKIQIQMANTIRMSIIWNDSHERYGATPLILERVDGEWDCTHAESSFGQLLMTITMVLLPGALCDQRGPVNGVFYGQDIDELGPLDQLVSWHSEQHGYWILLVVNIQFKMIKTYRGMNCPSNASMLEILFGPRLRRRSSCILSRILCWATSKGKARLRVFPILKWALSFLRVDSLEGKLIRKTKQMDLHESYSRNGQVVVIYQCLYTICCTHLAASIVLKRRLEVFFFRP